MVMLCLDPEIEAALRREAAVSERSISEVASLLLSPLLLDE
jgi:hypothetical protein